MGKLDDLGVLHLYETTNWPGIGPSTFPTEVALSDNIQRPRVDILVNVSRQMPTAGPPKPLRRPAGGLCIAALRHCVFFLKMISDLEQQNLLASIGREQDIIFIINKWIPVGESNKTGFTDINIVLQNQHGKWKWKHMGISILKTRNDWRNTMGPDSGTTLVDSWLVTFTDADVIV